MPLRDGQYQRRVDKTFAFVRLEWPESRSRWKVTDRSGRHTRPTDDELSAWYAPVLPIRSETE